MEQAATHPPPSLLLHATGRSLDQGLDRRVEAVALDRLGCVHVVEGIRDQGQVRIVQPFHELLGCASVMRIPSTTPPYPYTTPPYTTPP